MVHGKTYSDPTTGRFLKPDEVDLSDRSRPTVRKTGEPASVSWEKMSKSKHNGVDPADCIRKYGADATRAHMLFQAPVGEVLDWHEEKIVGIQRWFGRVWKVVLSTVTLTDADAARHPSEPKQPHNFILPLPPPSDLSAAEADLCAGTNRTITSVTTALDSTIALNTVVSDLIKLTNSLAALPPTVDDVSPPVRDHAVSALLRMLAPIAPAFAEECWEALHSGRLSPVSRPTTSLRGSQSPGHDPGHHPGHGDPATSHYTDSIFHHPFPTSYPPSALLRARVKQTCAVQENGRLRFAVEIGRPPGWVLGAGGEGDGSGSAEGDRESEMERREEMERWVLEELGRTEVGGRWLKGKGVGCGADSDGEAKKRWKRIVVVKGGRTVNFVG